MNDHEAKDILHASRPGGEDDSDPAIAAALRLAARDPHLSRWLSDQRRFDSAAATALRTIVPPRGLRERLLALPGTASPIPRPTFPYRTAIAIAATLLVLAAAAWLIIPRPAPPGMTLARFAEAVIEIKKSGGITLPQTGPNPAELKSWLAIQGSPSDFPIPAGLESHRSLGCQSFMIDGRKVSLICFQIDEHRIVHFFVVDSEDLLSAPGRSPHFFHQDGLAAVTWSAHGRTFILTGKDVDEQTLRSLIS